MVLVELVPAIAALFTGHSRCFVSSIAFFRGFWAPNHLNYGAMLCVAGFERRRASRSGSTGDNVVIYCDLYDEWVIYLSFYNHFEAKLGLGVPGGGKERMKIIS